MEAGECYAIITTFGKNSEVPNNKYTVYIPCYPDEISDATSINWSETGIIGRSSPIYAYNSTSSREISFSFDVHQDMFNGSTEIDDMLTALRSAAYPNYEASGLIPPIVSFRFGEFRTRGILNSITFVWKKPIRNRKYIYGTVTVSMKETPNNIFSGKELYSPLNPFNVS